MHNNFMNPFFQDPLVLSMQNVFLAAFLIVSIILILLKRKESPYLLSILPLFALTFHQVDEYILSPLLLGNEYHFLNWAYRSGLDISPIEVASINFFGYLPALIIFLFNPSTKLFALLFILVTSTTLANAMFHLGLSTVQTEYSPGMVTALFLFLPLYIKSVLLASERMASLKQIFVCSLYGFGIHYIAIWLVNIY
jgi:hypothetical protein